MRFRVGKNPKILSWLVDTGCEISQISWKVAQAYWNDIRPVGTARLKCVSATSASVKDLQLVILDGVRNVAPDGSTMGRAWSVEVLINPALKHLSLYLGAEFDFDDAGTSGFPARVGSDPRS